MQSTQQVIPLPFATEAHPMVQTIVPPIIHTHVQPHFEYQHQIYHAPEYYVEEDERCNDIKGIQENYHILEKRLRAMEGDIVFSAASREMCLVSDLVISMKFKTPDFD